MTRLAVPRLARAGLLFAAAAASVQPAHAAKAPSFYVAAAEVSINPQAKQGGEVADALRQAVADEARYYDPTRAPVVMRVKIEKVGFKSAGKAIAANLPLVGMFSGRNRNFMKGRVELVDQASGKPLKTYKVECDDDTQFSAGDGMLAYAKLGAGFLPFGQLIEAAMSVGDGALNKRPQAERMLTRGFVMLSYKKAYGNSLYKSFAKRRKADAELANGKAAGAAGIANASPVPALSAVPPVPPAASGEGASAMSIAER